MSACFWASFSSSFSILADMLLDVKEKKSVLEMAITLAKTFFLVIGFGFVFANNVFASLAVVPSVDHLFSTQSRVLITGLLIMIAAIWKLFNAKSRGDHPHNHDIPVAPPPDPPETWYAVDPFSPPIFTTATSPESKSSPSPPLEPVIPPETPEEEVAWSCDDGENSMDATWKAIMEGGGRPVKPVLKKSQTWEKCNEVTVVGEQAVVRRKMRKSETFKEKAKAMEEGWRKRDVLVVNQDELFRRVETFIEKHHENLRLQRQESDRRRFLERLR